MSESKLLNQHSKELDKNGIVIIENYLSKGKCDEISAAIEKNVEEGNYVTRKSIENKDLADNSKPILNKRKGTIDDGMVDIFHVDSYHPQIREFKNDNFILELINNVESPQEYEVGHVNSYINNGVSGTRGYHADTYSGKYKSFVYLSDVLEEKDGPYSFILGSHKPGIFTRRVRIYANKMRKHPPTDALSYEKSKLKVCYGRKGSLIISNQAGLHRGLPQSSDRKRILITTSYYKKGKFSKIVPS